MEEGGARQQNCSELVKETEIAAAERCREATTKPERGRSEASSQSCAFSSHVRSHTPPGIKERDTLNIKAVANTWKISCQRLAAPRLRCHHPHMAFCSSVLHHVFSKWVFFLFVFFILRSVEKKTKNKLKIGVAFVKRGPFRDEPALTTQPQKKERENQGKWKGEDEIRLQRSISLLISLCSCVRVCVSTPVCMCVSECVSEWWGTNIISVQKREKKGLKNKLVLCGNSFSQITQHSRY